MTEDIHKVDRPVFDPIRIRSNQENSDGLQKRRGQTNKNRPLTGLAEEQPSGSDAPELVEGGNRLLDIQV
jgi:hypothetical protein